MFADTAVEASSLAGRGATLVAGGAEGEGAHTIRWAAAFALRNLSPLPSTFALGPLSLEINRGLNFFSRPKERTK